MLAISAPIRGRGTGRGSCPSARPGPRASGAGRAASPSRRSGRSTAGSLGDHADRDVVVGALAGDDRGAAGGRRARRARGLVGAVVLDEGDERAQGVLDGVAVRRLHARRRGPDVLLRGQRLRHPVEDRAVTDGARATIRGVRDQGAWLEIRSISAITGCRSLGASSSRWNAVQGELVGHRRVAEPRAGVPDVAGVVELVVVVEARLRPVPGVGGHVADRAPARRA